MDYIKIHFLEGLEEPDPASERSLDDLLHLSHPRFLLSRHPWRPQIDIVETETEILIQGEIAGVPGEAIALKIAPGAIKISGVREIGVREDDARYHLAEIPCGYFERTLTLPAVIDTQSAEASCRDGLLEIRLKKRPLNQIRRIHIHKG